MIRGIVFDFDLTLVDSAAGICANLNALAEKKGLRRVSDDEVHVTIGWALVDAMRTFWGEGPVESEWLPLYRRLFVERNYAGVKAFPEAKAALERLYNAKVPMAIATNRLTPEGIVRASGLDSYVSAIVGIEKLKPKPDPAIVLEALRRLGIEASEGIYVGDSVIDMQTAVAAGVTGVGVTTGNHDAASLRQNGASYVLENLNRLPELWEELHGKD